MKRWTVEIVFSTGRRKPTGRKFWLRSSAVLEAARLEAITGRTFEVVRWRS